MPKGRRWQFFRKPLEQVESQSRQHLAAALSMDLLALCGKGLLP